MKKIKRILVANRGEIACRIIRTCDQLAIETIAIYSDVDKDLPFVKLATKAIALEGCEARETYLDINKIVKICQEHQVDAVHPGYGFLSENAAFAEALNQIGVIFIGPSPAAIRAMGSKSEAKMIAEKVGINTIKGYMGADQDTEVLLKHAKQIGFPILIKAVHGGGGKGMRRVDSEADFTSALASCQREAQSAFGNADVMLEKYIVDPRHIEIQVFGDQHGTVLTLSERDCSLQRRHQKIVEEAPAIGLAEVTRAGLHQDAQAISASVNYVGAGTVEFLVDAEGNYYFLEMNTRLQVEHPATEMILGLDLVEWQIRVAEGQPLPLSQSQIRPRGHAIEVRLYAEDPHQGFLPSIGQITELALDTDTSVRLDSGYQNGNQVSIYYDPILAKLIVHADNRRAAFHKAVKALAKLQIKGVKTNRQFLIELLQNPDVCEKLPHIAYLDHHMAQLLKPTMPDDITKKVLAKSLLNTLSRQGSSPWDAADGWRHLSRGQQLLRFDCQDEMMQSILESHEDLPPALMLDQDVNSITLSINGKVYHATLPQLDHGADDAASKDQKLNAPMPGRVISVLASLGEKVEAGCPLMILEAMKMEHTIRAPFDGIVEDVFYKTGDFVDDGAELVRLIAA
ncbi:acetyl/propionyl/methylcrotonyl-CoA carboxylase subunit alpha [Candidatus Odyssella thessalonicensis]|uniref:acetyl/propionyl/methylcrotonyl-CoA carboxylase subunit alpha n=1 Tax=Candidatus Odyssella thessalonicensis TaxID=84647 RepID=UPI000225B91C|nr:biotin carboxylase N-terminal domain-containing protein [Candidatus Odyssella thessalonicensis]